MNYRLMLSEMMIDYVERLNKEPNIEKQSVYKEVIKDIRLILDLEVEHIEIKSYTKNKN